MTQIIKPKKNRLEVADILHKHIADYKTEYPLWPEHKKIVADILNCRSAHLGGHIERCDTCGVVRSTYHSCRNSHCPKCQHMPREKWLEKRKTTPYLMNPFATSMKNPERKRALKKEKVFTH